MNSASRQAAASRDEPWQRWVAALASALLHVLMVLALLFAEPPTVTTPQGSTGGSRTRVDFVGETAAQTNVAPPSPAPAQAPAPKPKSRPKPKPAATSPAASPVQSALVEQAENPLPPDPADLSDPLPQPEPAQPTQDTAARNPTRTPAASPPSSNERHPENWGRPPGMLDEATAPRDQGLANNDAADNGYRNDPSAGGPSLDVGGYQVYYDLRNEDRLREWIDKGIKELFLPLPGTQYYMVCQAQIALKRGSGKCRLLDPSSPELKQIGDARNVIDMIQVYRRGELVWRGPGPYR